MHDVTFQPRDHPSPCRARKPGVRFRRKEGSLVESPVKNKLEYRDLLAIPDDGKRYELLDGEVSVTPAPSPVHQRIVLALAVRFIEYFHARGIGEVFVSPLDVILTDRDVIEPDVVVVGRPAQISHRGIEGSPLLVVEVLSPSTRE